MVVGLGELTLIPGNGATTGIYIMQNTMVRGGDGQPGKKMKLGVRKKERKRGKKKRRKITLIVFCCFPKLYKE